MIQQQIVISGLGGQGVLFITRLLAEAAMANGHSVLTSETHGMAQRGGTVVSHLKVGDFSSPLIRPAAADGIIALKTETLSQHDYFKGQGAWVVVNSDSDINDALSVDADKIATKNGNPASVNLVMLGAALAAMENEKNALCSLQDIKEVLKNRFGQKKKGVFESAAITLEDGYSILKQKK